MSSCGQNQVSPAILKPMPEGREYVRLRRRAYNGRPLPRQGGGRHLGFILAWCRQELGLSKGAFVRSLAQRLGTTRGRIYRVIDGELGLSPDALWRLGTALHELGVWQMSGPLALALEPRYDAHLLGVVGELVLDPMHFLMRGFLFDFLWHRSWFRNQDASAIEHILHYGVVSPPRFDLFEAAWNRWYASDVNQLAAKEREENFAQVVPPLARAVSILRAQQRDDDPGTYDPSYRIILRDAEKDIRSYFFAGGHDRIKFSVNTSPRFNLLSDEEFGKTRFAKRLKAIISPDGDRVPPSDAYRNGWDLRVRESSGLLALALFDYEREYYLLTAAIMKPLLPAIHRLLQGRKRPNDYQILLGLKRWWRPFSVIACLMGPLDDTLRRMWDELARLILASWDNDRRAATHGLVQVRDLHEALFSETDCGRKLRAMITLPNEVATDLSKYSIKNTYDPSDYHTAATPRQLASVLDMLHRSEFGYQPSDTREELYWWLRDVAVALDAVN